MRNLTRIDRDGAKVPRSPMTAMVHTSLSDCLSSKALIVVLILAQAFFLLPGLVGYPTLSDLAIGQEQVNQTLEILSTGMESGAYDSAPDALKDINARELEALTTASNAPYPSKEFFIAYAQYYDVEIECAKLGHTESTPSLYARSELIHRLAGLEKPEVYASATEMPATYYLAFVLGLMPGIILLLPVALLTSGSQRRLGGRTLVSMAPVSRASERLACTAVASVLSLACLAAALLPAALLAAIRNGIGDFAYPVACVTDGVVSSSTIGDVLAQDAALMTFASLMVVALVAVAESIRAHCGLGAAFALLVCPLIPIYTSQSTRWRAVARHLPSSYISCGSVVGLPVYANGLDIRAIPGTTWELGLATLFLFAIALLAIALFTDMARERTATKQLARRFS